MRSRRELGAEELDAALRRTRMGFHRSIAAMAEAGNDIVVDHVLSEPWRLLDCLTVLRPEDVLFVGVHCPLDELARSDRPQGLAAAGVAGAGASHAPPPARRRLWMGDVRYAGLNAPRVRGFSPGEAYQIDSTHSGWSTNGLRLCW